MCSKCCSIEEIASPRPVIFFTWRRAPSPWRITFAPGRRSSPYPRSAMEHCTVAPYLLRAGPVVLKAETPNAPRDPEWGRHERALPQLMAQRGTKKDPHSWPNSKEMAPRSWPFLARNSFTWNAVRGRPRGAPCLVAQRGEANKGEATILWRRVQPCGATWGGE